MTDAQHTQLSTYVRTLADMFGLRDSVIVIKRDESCKESCLLDIVNIPGRKFWEIRQSPAFWARSVEEQREDIVHELLHVHMNPTLEYVRIDLYENRVIGYELYGLLCDAMVRTLELGVDGVTHAIAHYFPLPEWNQDPT
jgi:hypothetical protein